MAIQRTAGADPDRDRVSKREFISRVSARSGLTLRTVNSVYEAMLEELTVAARQGETVVLTGFGRFYRQDHKGHKVRFGKDDVDDYSVLKFSASRSTNRRLDPAFDDEAAKQFYEVFDSDELALTGS